MLFLHALDGIEMFTYAASTACVVCDGGGLALFLLHFKIIFIPIWESFQSAASKVVQGD
jgi:hypothetical protein